MAKKRSKVRGAKSRVALVVDVFPTTLQSYVIDRFVRLRELGWDARVICTQFDEDEWTRIPVLAANPKLRKRVSVTDNQGHGLAVEALAPQVVHVEFAVLAPQLAPLFDQLDCKFVVSFQFYDARLVARPDLYGFVWTKAAAVHAVSEHLWHFIQRAGCPTNKLHAVIPPGVDADFFDPGPRVHTDVVNPTRPLRVLSVGRLHWIKGYEYGLQAIRLLVGQGVPCEYRIVGGGSLRPAVEYAIDDLGLTDMVRLLGARSPAEVKEQLSWADVLLHASVSEAFGIATIEAQAMMVPVVCSDANGLTEAVANGETGLVVPRRDPGALAAALARLAQDPGERQRLGEAGRRRVQAQFRPETVARQFDTLYRHVLALPCDRRTSNERP